MNTEKDLYDSLLFEYACGALDEALSLMIASHLSLSQNARRRVAVLESMGGVMIEQSCEPVAMQKSSLQAVLNQLECPDAKARCNPEPEKITRNTVKNVDLPNALNRALCPPGVAVRWRRRTVGLSVMKVNCTGNERKVRLYRATPGARLPQYRHRGREMTLVLDGALIEGKQIYRRGDMFIIEESRTHNTKACDQQGCVFLVANRGHIGLAGLIERLMGL